MNYGFIEPSPEDIKKSVEKGFVLGARGGVKGKVINEAGDWRNYLPGFEPQRRSFESNSCTQFATESALEALETFQEGVHNNYSERLLAIDSDNSRQGNDPHKTSETLRKKGVAPEEMLPFTDSLKSWEDYMTLDNDYKIEQEKKKWLRANVFKHEWVWTGKPSPEEKRRRLKEALTKGTVCVSVHAWRKKNGIYVKNGEPDNHWTQLATYDVDHPLVNDSYLDDGSPLKKLDPLYDFSWAKVYYLSPRVLTFWDKMLLRMCYN